MLQHSWELTNAICQIFRQLATLRALMRGIWSLRYLGTRFFCANYVADPKKITRKKKDFAYFFE